MSLLFTSPFARDLVRLIAGWVACIVFVQAMASALGLVQGPRHVHVPTQAVATVVFVHATAHAHGPEQHAHSHWERHVHLSPTADPTLHDDAQELGATAGLALSAILALGPPRGDLRVPDGGHVMHASLAWSCITHAAPFPERPPRA